MERFSSIAKPKSQIFKIPFAGSSNKFSGLISQWIIPHLWIYAKEINNNDISAVVSLIEKYGADQLKSGLEKNQLNTQSETKKHDCVIMTAHKSKGLEFDNVILNDDFFYNIKDGELSISQDESRLLYVACTRAKLNLDISKLDELFDYIV